MRVRRIVSTNFQIAGGGVELDLPETGLVLVTGRNGHGKSGLIEAVAFGLWGETLRGRTPWVDGVEGRLSVDTDDVSVIRTATKGGAKKLRWRRPGGEIAAYKSPTEAQKALDEVVGPFGVWRRCSVFSSADASAFSTAKDRERKLLLEDLLGGVRFDEAVRRCRLDLSGLRDRLSRADRNAAVLEERMASAHARLADAERALETPSRATAADVERLSRELSGLEQKTEAARKRHLDFKVEAVARPPEIGRISAQLDEATRRHRALQHGECPTCGASISAERVAALSVEITSLRESIEALRSAAEAARSTASTSAGEAMRDLEKLEARLRGLRQETADARSAVRVAAEASARHAQLKMEVSSQVATLREESEALAGETEKLRWEVSTLEVVERVLGLRGVRSHVLGRALGGFEEVANSYLDRIGGGLRLSVQPTTDLKTGGTSDAISMTVSGAGGGDYAGGSGGQRRRLDIALVLGLSELADAARGSVPGDLWFDEVFDALDDDGVDGVSEILLDLSANRKVTVISHNHALVSRLRPLSALALELEGGRVRR